MGNCDSLIVNWQQNVNRVYFGGRLINFQNRKCWNSCISISLSLYQYFCWFRDKHEKAPAWLLSMLPVGSKFGHIASSHVTSHWQNLISFHRVILSLHNSYNICNSYHPTEFLAAFHKSVWVQESCWLIINSCQKDVEVFCVALVTYKLR